MSVVAYLGGPIAPRELLYDPERSLIEQSRRHAPNMEVLREHDQRLRLLVRVGDGASQILGGGV